MHCRLYTASKFSKETREVCHTFQVNEEEEFSEVLKKKLWKISACRLNVQPSEEEKSQVLIRFCQFGLFSSRKKCLPSMETHQNNGLVF